MREDYDFYRGVRGEYVEWVGDVSKLVVLEPDVAREFPTAEAVNEALRSGFARRTGSSILRIRANHALQQTPLLLALLAIVFGLGLPSSTVACRPATQLN